MRVDGPGHLAELDLVDEQCRDDLHVATLRHLRRVAAQGRRSGQPGEHRLDESVDEVSARDGTTRPMRPIGSGRPDRGRAPASRDPPAPGPLRRARGHIRYRIGASCAASPDPLAAADRRACRPWPRLVQPVDPRLDRLAEPAGLAHLGRAEPGLELGQRVVVRRRAPLRRARFGTSPSQRLHQDPVTRPAPPATPPPDPRRAATQPPTAAAATLARACTIGFAR